MVLILSSDDVRRLLRYTHCTCVRVIEEAYREWYGGGADTFPRFHVPMRNELGRHAILKCIVGALRSKGIFAVRLNVSVRGIEEVGGRVRLRRFDDRNWGFIMLFSALTGELLAIMPEHEVSKARVGATSAVGMKYLAREDAETLAIIGSGEQAAAQVMGALCVRDIRSIRVYSPNSDHRRRFAKIVSELTGVKVSPVDSPEAAVRGSDIVLAATSSFEPVIKGAWLEPGQHVGSIVGGGNSNWVRSIELRHPLSAWIRRAPEEFRLSLRRRELDEEAVLRADVIVVNSREEIVLDSQSTILDEIMSGKLDPSKVHELPELVAGKVVGRTSRDQVTLFYNNVGTGVQFAAVCSLLYELARKHGVGTEVSPELFSEDKSGWLNPDAAP